MAGDDLQTKATDIVKKVLTVGVGAIFLTEESLRALVSDIKLPKELIGGILDSAKKTRDEFIGKLSQDVIARITDRVDPAKVLQEFFQNNEIELSIKVNARPKAESTPESVE